MLEQADLNGLMSLLQHVDDASRDRLIDSVAALAQADRQQVEAAATTAGVGLELVNAAVIRRRYHELGTAWQSLSARTTPDLEQGLILLGAATGTPGVDDPGADLDQLAAQAGERLHGDRAFDNGMKILAEIFNARGMRGNESDYANPANSSLQSVLLTGLGIPISLCQVAILVGRRLGLPVHGVGAPGHFLGFYGDADLGHGSYFDPFAGFAAVTRAGAKQRILRAGVVFDDSMLRAVDDRYMLLRTINNLTAAWGGGEHARNLSAWARVLGQ